MKPWMEYFLPMISPSFIANLPIYNERFESLKKWQKYLYYFYCLFSTAVIAFFFAIAFGNLLKAETLFEGVIFLQVIINYFIGCLNTLALHYKKKELDEFIRTYREIIEKADDRLDHHLNSSLKSPTTVSKVAPIVILAMTSTYFGLNFYFMFFRGEIVQIISYRTTLVDYSDNIHLARVMLLLIMFSNMNLLYRMFAVINIWITLFSLQTALYLYLKELCSKDDNLEDGSSSLGFYNGQWVKLHQTAFRLSELVQSITSLPIFLMLFSLMCCCSIIGIMYLSDGNVFQKVAANYIMASFMFVVAIVCNAAEGLEKAHASVLEDVPTENVVFDERKQNYFICRARTGKKLNFSALNMYPVTNELIYGFLSFTFSLIMTLMQVAGGQKRHQRAVDE